MEPKSPVSALYQIGEGSRSIPELDHSNVRRHMYFNEREWNCVLAYELSLMEIPGYSRIFPNISHLCIACEPNTMYAPAFSGIVEERWHYVRQDCCFLVPLCGAMTNGNSPKSAFKIGFVFEMFDLDSIIERQRKGARMLQRF